MPVYERETRVDAPFEEVWDFHSRGEGLEALTPGFMRLRIERTIGPDGEMNPELLEEGTRIEATVNPFGVGTRRGWTSIIVTRKEHDGAAVFVDEMTDGPFPHWQHTHAFYADGKGTLIRDRVEYAFPYGLLGRAVGTFGVVGFEPMFRYRHHKTRTLLE